MQLELSLPAAQKFEADDVTRMMEESLGVKSTGVVDETGRYLVESKMKGEEAVEDTAMQIELKLQEEYPDETVSVRSCHEDSDVSCIQLLLNPPEAA